MKKHIHFNLWFPLRQSAYNPALNAIITYAIVIMTMTNGL